MKPVTIAHMPKPIAPVKLCQRKLTQCWIAVAHSAVAETRSMARTIGLAYKPGTSDWRESPSMAVAARLIELGAEVPAHDAHVPDGVALEATQRHSP